ncbi:MAG: transcription elongation factor GreA [Acidobacteriia bacterium]|jgi:transcription elongation factor GreA|nr:transcription elongation factor GreA [Terriglobia bacterium]
MNNAEARIRRKLEEEIRLIEHELKNELPKELMKARAHGDLSENSEYKYAKERQSYLSARLSQLQKRLANVSLLNLNNLPRDRVGYGSQVRLLDIEKGTEVAYKLVTSEEADAAQGLISTTSPIGRALLGRAVGDEVRVQTPGGLKRFEIVSLRTIYDDPELQGP